MSTVGVWAITRDESAVVERWAQAAALLDGPRFVVDTGSMDDSPCRAAAAGCEVAHSAWASFGVNLTAALRFAQLAHPEVEWWLRLDADMTVDVHPDLVEWLAGDPDPSVNAWMVPIVDGTLRYSLPMLTRALPDWEYVGATHEYLDREGGVVRRDLLGLTLHHHADGGCRGDKFERDLALLDGDDPRSVYYRAQTLRDLGRTDEAIDAYRLRATMPGWDEEGWHAAYQAALLAEDVDALVAVWRQRPHRHEPLTAAARIVGRGGAASDVLFLERAPE